METSVRILAAILSACMLSAAALANDVATEVRSGLTGVSSEISTLDRAPDDKPKGTMPTSLGRLEGTILWQRHLNDAIYTSTGINGPSEMAFAGTTWNPPMHAEATPLLGNGTPDWTSDGVSFFVDASRDGQVLAAVDFNQADSTATIMEWRPGSGTPLWTHVVHPCRSLIYQGWAGRKPIQVSDDGSTIAAAIVMYTPAGQRGRLFAFDAGNGTPAVDWEFPEGNVVATEITEHGEYIAMAGWPTLYVYDRYGQTLRWSGPIFSGNDALAISGDGRYLAWGWTTFRLLEWNGMSYAPVWTHTPGSNTYVGQCALSGDGGTLALSWDNGNSFPNWITLELYALPSRDLLWTYNYVSSPSAHGAGAAAPESGQLLQSVDIPSQMRFTPDGQHLAVGSWGGDFPELHVFARSTPDPLYVLDTPGSIFDIDAVSSPGGNVHVTACGKAVHAGQGGRGGDLYAIEVSDLTTDVSPGASLPGSFTLAPNCPNPFNPRTTIPYSLESAGPIRLTIHDPEGRLVRTLVAGTAPAGRQATVWTGIDDAGAAVASGVYLVRLESGNRTQVRKMLLAK